MGVRLQRDCGGLAALGFLNPLISGAAMVLSSGFVSIKHRTESGAQVNPGFGRELRD